MNIKYRRNIRRLVFTILVYVFCYLIETTLLKNTNFYLTQPICPVFGLLFGPYGAIGVAIGNIITYNIVDPDIYAIPFTLIQFLNAYIPYKLWYIFNKDESYPLKLDTVSKFIKFIVIITLTTFAFVPLINIFEQYRLAAPLITYDTIQWALGFFDLSIIFAIISFMIVDLFNIPIYKPNTSKSKIPKKIFYAFYIIAISLGIINFIYINLYDLSLFEPYYGILVLILFVLFSVIPITGKIADHTRHINKIHYNKEEPKLNDKSISLIERLLTLFQIINVVLAIIFGLISYHFIMSSFPGENVYFDIGFAMFVFITLFYVPGVIILYFVEKHITNPIEVISDTAKNYVDKDHNELGDVDEVYNKFCKYADESTEVGDLAFSYYKMINDIEQYVDNLKKLTTEKERIKTELNVAKNIQESFIPTNFSEINNDYVHLYGMMKPAKEVGGDFYDFYYIDDTHLVFLIGDVAGKGVPASLYMVVTKSLIKNSFENIRKIDEIYYEVNNQLCHDNDENLFITSWIGMLDISSGKLEYINAGHNPPVIKRHNKYGWLKSEVCIVLGGLEDVPYTTSETTLEEGDQILLYTDGVTEANNMYNGFFGEDKLIKSLEESSDLSIEEQVKHIKSNIDEFTDGIEEQFDDITMLLMEYKRK